VKEVWFKGQHTDIGGGAPPPKSLDCNPEWLKKNNPPSSSLPILDSLGGTSKSKRDAPPGPSTPLLSYPNGLPKDQSGGLSNSVASPAGSLDVDGKVRGASPPNYATLSNIALRWMVRQCLLADVDIVFNQQTLACYRHEKVGVLEVNPSTKSAKLDACDIIHTPYDAMNAGANRLLWHFLEFWPAWRQVQNGMMECNQGRHIQEELPAWLTKFNAGLTSVVGSLWGVLRSWVPKLLKAEQVEVPQKTKGLSMEIGSDSFLE
jgi:hypothetical protein